MVNARALAATVALGAVVGSAIQIFSVPARSDATTRAVPLAQAPARVERDEARRAERRSIPTPSPAAASSTAPTDVVVIPLPSLVAATEPAPAEDTKTFVNPGVIPDGIVPDISGHETGVLLSMPVTGRATSSFGMRFHPVLHVWKLHTGQDWAASCGTPVGAAAPGTVVSTKFAGGNGVQVKIDHGTIAGHHVFTTYNHLSSIGVRVGQQVGVHQGVGRVGNTGYSTGCHLHFEVIADGQFTDPMPWLNGRPVMVDISAMTTSVIPVPSASPSVSPSPGASPTPTPSLSPTPTVAPSPSASTVPSVSPSPSASPTVVPSETSPAAPSPTPSASEVAPSPTVEPSGSPSETSSETVASPTPSVSPSPTPSASPTATSASPTVSDEAMPSPTA